jgi:hypothetical protein
MRLYSGRHWEGGCDGLDKEVLQEKVQGKNSVLGFTRIACNELLPTLVWGILFHRHCTAGGRHHRLILLLHVHVRHV